MSNELKYRSQGSKGIRQWPINWCTSQIYKITPSVDCNKWLKRLDTQLDKSINQNSSKVPKVVEPTNKKTYYKTLGTSVINSPLPPPSLENITSVFTLYKTCPTVTGISKSSLKSLEQFKHVLIKVLIVSKSTN